MNNNIDSESQTIDYYSGPLRPLVQENNSYQYLSCKKENYIY